MGKNEKIYKLYRPFSYDYLFYSAIIFLFATITKGISVGQFMYICAIYSVFFAIFQIPLNYVVESLGIKKSMILGNMFCIVHLVIYIFASRFEFLALAEMFCALGFSLKGLTETQMLYKSLKNNGKASKYAKTEGKGVSRYYFIEAVGTLFIGYLFTISNYIPIIITLSFVIVALGLSFLFEDIDVDFEADYTSLKAYTRNFRKIIRSPRLISLFVFAFFTTGFVEVIKVLQKSVIVDLDVKPEMYTIIMAVLTLAVGLGSRIENKFEKITKRKNLTIVGSVICLSILLIGIINTVFIGTFLKLNITVVILLIYNIFQGIYRISIKKYLNNFTTSAIRGKILAIFYIFEGIGRAALLFGSGLFIDNIKINYACIILGTLMISIMVLLVKFMSSRVGLDPNQYTREDLCGRVPSELTK